MYAYVEPPVHKVTLEIDRDDDHNGENPKVTYKVKLHPVDFIKLKALQAVQRKQDTLLKKASLLALAKLGAPISFKHNIIQRAQEYLPPQYTIQVDIINE